MNIKVRNAYFLIAGVLAMLFAFTHAWYGQSAVLPTLLVNSISLDNWIVFSYVWHIITAENLVFAIAFILMSLQNDQSKIQSVVWMIVSLLIVRMMVILGITAFYDVAALTNTLIDSIAIVIYVVLIILGITMSRKKFS